MSFPKNIGKGAPIDVLLSPSSLLQMEIIFFGEGIDILSTVAPDFFVTISDYLLRKYNVRLIITK